MKKLRCVHCNEIIEDGIGHNPEPTYNTGRTCDRCNAMVIFPERFMLRRQFKPKKEQVKQ